MKQAAHCSATVPHPGAPLLKVETLSNDTNGWGFFVRDYCNKKKNTAKYFSDSNLDALHHLCQFVQCLEKITYFSKRFQKAF